MFLRGNKISLTILLLLILIIGFTISLTAQENIKGGCFDLSNDWTTCYSG